MKNFFLSFISLVFSAHAIAQTAQMVKDAESIQHLLDDFSNAWNAHNAKGFSMAFSEDADFTNLRGMSAHGRMEIEKFLDKPFTSQLKKSTLKITDKKIRFITADIAAVDAWWEMTGALGTDGKDIPPMKGLLNFLLTRGDGKWFITVMHNMTPPSK
jgi:uncharacterized protein (TIGR02246 family)